MSIALIINTKPSRILLGSSLLMLALVHCSLWLLIAPFDLHWLLKSLAVLTSSGVSMHFVCRLWRKNQRSRCLHISPSGELVLHGKRVLDDHAGGMIVHLSHKSRFWTYILSIFLIDDDGREHKLLILPDSLTTVEFRALRVSLMWIAQHHDA